MAAKCWLHVGENTQERRWNIILSFSPLFNSFVFFVFVFNSFHVGEITQGRIILYTSFSPLWTGFFYKLFLLVFVRWRGDSQESINMYSRSPLYETGILYFCAFQFCAFWCFSFCDMPFYEVAILALFWVCHFSQWSIGCVIVCIVPWALYCIYIV